MMIVRFFRALVAVAKALPQLSGVDNRGGWWPIVSESFSGAWQRSVTVDTTTVLSFSALYACITLIASDVAKMRLKLMKQVSPGIWSETSNAAFSPVLRKPNHFQTRIQFFMNWIASKLIHGNTYVLKGRDQRGVVVALYVLDPTRCRPLVAPDGGVFYELKADNLAAPAMEDIPTVPNGDIVVPASEVIHDVMVPLFHPLVGVSPIRACGLAALQGLRIQENSTRFFQSGSNPGGVLSAPGFINDETAQRLKKYWEENFTGVNVGKVAVLGDGLKFEKMAVNAVDAQLIDQLKWTAENVCTAFHVPPFKIGIGAPPNFNVVEALDQQYYSQCVQIHIESIELLLDEGLGMAKDGGPQEFGTEFDLDDLLRMDTANVVKSASEAIKGGGVSPNEARKRFFGLGPVPGGDAPYLQQQNFSLEALAKRDAREDPFETSTSARATPPTPPPADDTADEKALVIASRYRKALAA